MAEQAIPFAPVDVTEGPFAGWKTWGYGGDPFETLTGPFFLRVGADGAVEAATLPGPAHRNGAGPLHGGFLMTFADFAIFAIAWRELGQQSAVTVSLTSEFLSAGVAGEALHCTGEVTRATRSLIFARGLVTQQGRPVLAFTGILKKTGPAATQPGPQAP